LLQSPDYGTANKNEARRYLRTYGLAPPGVDSYENQMKRCKGQSWYTGEKNVGADNCFKVSVCSR
jgi:hypothetical protein